MSKQRLVEVVDIEFEWYPGFSLSQKRKCITSLHARAAKSGMSPLLEISTKSDDFLGQKLSAFNLLTTHSEYGEIALECAFQGSKVFERAGPFIDLLTVQPRDAKKDPRLRESGRLVQFSFDGLCFPITPVTAFYDWLYLTALSKIEGCFSHLNSYDGFTDIEFNPEKSLNCQARSCATFVALSRLGMIELLMKSPSEFIRALS